MFGLAAARRASRPTSRQQHRANHSIPRRHRHTNSKEIARGPSNCVTSDIQMLRISGLFLACALCVSMAQQQYVVTTVAGGGAPPVTSIAADNLVGLVTAVATDPAGAVYIGAENCVFKIDSSGTMTRIAGTGRAGFSGDGGAAVNAQLGQVYGLAFDGKGSLLIADSGASVIRRVTGGVISTVPGSAIAAIGLPIRAAIGPSGDIFISDPHANLVWKISPAGALSIFAGNSDFG